LIATHSALGCASGAVDVHLNVVGSGQTPLSPAAPELLEAELPLDPEPALDPEPLLGPDSLPGPPPPPELAELVLDAELPPEPDGLLDPDSLAPEGVPASASSVEKLPADDAPHAASAATRAGSTRFDRRGMPTQQCGPKSASVKKTTARRIRRSRATARCGALT